MVLTALSTLMTGHYHLSELQTGLTFLSNGAGCICGTLLTGKLLDMDYRHIKESFTGSPDDFPLERARLRLIWLYGVLQCASVLTFGWTIEKGVHVAVPVICLFVLGWTAISMQSIVSTFLVDVFPQKSASAMAALNLVRCLLGAGGAAFVMPCINTMNVGWTFTLCMFTMLLSFGLVAVQMKYGPSWRQKREQKAAETQNDRV
jgi:predicted MFS family arabinose efflux permease